MEFNVKDFCEAPTLAKLEGQALRNDDWRFIAQYFEVPFSSTATKEVIKNIVVEALVLGEYLPEEAIDIFTPASSSNPVHVKDQQTLGSE